MPASKRKTKKLPPREVRNELVRVLCLVYRGFQTKRLKDQTMITMSRGNARMESLSDIVKAALLKAGVTVAMAPAKATPKPKRAVNPTLAA